MPKEQKNKAIKVFTTVVSWLKNVCLRIISVISKIITRQFISYTLMVAFIVLTGLGAGIYSPAIGFIVAGIGCGILGFLLGLE